MAGHEGLRVLVAGGGTGGHLYPGIAVAREIVRRRPDAEVTFVGTARGLEARVVPREGFPLELIRSAGLKGKSIDALARGVGLLPLSGVDAWRVVGRRQPHLVMGVGGYSSGPVVLVAALRRIPTMLIEQNAVPGLANRRLAPFVDAAAVTWEETLRWFGSKGFVSGNPVREGFLAIGGAPQAGADEGEVRVLVFGGSQGAHAINVAMVEAAGRFAASPLRVRITHQTGEKDVEDVRAGYARAGLAATVAPFLYDMDRQMAAADLIVSRAGATTLAEVTTAGKPAVLVPLPTATDDHQRKNAEALERLGGAMVVAQDGLTGDRLADVVLALAADRPAREAMARAARAAARPDAARVIVDKVFALVAGRGGQG